MPTVNSSFPSKKPCYRYIRESDRLPVRDDEAGAEQLCPVKLFNPNGVGTWWIAEYDPETRVCFGVVDMNQGRELGYFAMDELVEFRGSYGLPIERDLYYKPVTIGQLVSLEEVA